MMKIAIINHTFQKDYFCKRWRMLAEMDSSLDVTLIAPKTYTWGDNKRLTYGDVEKIDGMEIDDNNFHIKLITMQPHKYRSWTSPDMKNLLVSLKPDVIYHIGHHQQESLIQVINIRNRYLKDSKVLAFSMRGPTVMRVERDGVSLPRYLLRKALFEYDWLKSKKVYKNTDAIFCHYPDGKNCFIQEGYKGPIYMQTQVGVDTEKFFPNKEAREKIRKKYNIGNAFLFGSASRFTSDKGLSDVISALPMTGNWKYLMMGFGLPEENEAIKKQIRERGLTDRIILTGFIDWHDMSDYWNALDCAVHVPRTTRTWVETFSLSVVQAMATGLPIIGDDSGSVPYQIGEDGIIIKEGDIEALRDKMLWVMNNKAEASEIGKLMKRRAEECFSIRHLTDMFYDTLHDIMIGKYDPQKEDMAKYNVEIITMQ